MKAAVRTSLVGALLASWLLAQATEPVVPGSTAPGERPSARRPELPEFLSETSDSGLSPPRGPEDEQPSMAPGSRSFKLRGVAFEGNTVFSDSVLEAIARDFVGKQVTLAELEELRYRLTRHYTDRGYINSGVVLKPGQVVDDGIVIYQVREGRLDAVRVNGTGRLRPDYVQDRVWPDPARPFNIASLQGRFQLLLRDPLIERLNGELRPGAGPDSAVLDLEVTGARPYALSFGVDNHGPPSTGAVRAYAAGTLRNLSGYGDALDFWLGFSEGADEVFGGCGVDQVFADYPIPITARGSRLFLRIDRSDRAVVEQPLEDLDIESETLSLELGLLHPLHRSLRRTATLGIALARRENQTFLLGAPFPFSLGAEDDGETRVTVLRLSQELLDRTARHALALRSTLNVGIDALGATDHEQDLPDSRFFAWLGQAQYARRLGHVHFLQRDLATAERLLRASLAQALRLQRPALAAASANRLGSVLSSQGRPDEAKTRYEQALALAQQAGDPGLVAAARRNRARLLHGEQALAELQAAREAAGAVASSYERADLLLGIALEADDSVLHYQALQEALSIAEDIGAPRLQSLAPGHLATFYEDQGRLAEARALTEQAILAAQTLNAHELLLHWEGQLGRLMRTQGDPAAAIDAYRRAIYQFQHIRQDILLAYHHGHFSFFREILAPFYLGLVDLLLQQAATETNEEQEQSLLREARETVERIKVSELQDYFRAPCLVAQTEEIEALSPKTAVLYPIILPDRLELLVSIGRHLYRSASAVDSNRLMEMIRYLSFRLRHRWPSRTGARRIYTRLIQPIAPLLEKHTVDTLVFVPDGPLRLVPIAALWDGQRYLVERYAIATAPGLTLLDPRPLPRKRMQSLLAGLSQLGPVVDQLPNAMLASLGRGVPQRTEQRRRGVPVTVHELRTPPLAPSELREQEALAAKVAQRLALPGVKQEINELAQLLAGTVLLDDQFRLKRFVSEVENQPYRVVHIASHGFFGGTAADSFILTYDDKLDMSVLAGLLRPKQLAERPVELLALSACQTAEGNDRTPLGLSGVALKSGARSALVPCGQSMTKPRSDCCPPSMGNLATLA